MLVALKVISLPIRQTICSFAAYTACGCVLHQKGSVYLSKLLSSQNKLRICKPIRLDHGNDYSPPLSASFCMHATSLSRPLGVHKTSTVFSLFFTSNGNEMTLRIINAHSAL